MSKCICGTKEAVEKYGYMSTCPIHSEILNEVEILRHELSELVFHSIQTGSISRARGAEILRISLIDLIDILDSRNV